MIYAVLALLVLVLLLQMRKTQGNRLEQHILRLEEIILRLELMNMAFIDDANTKLTALNDAIAKIPGAQPPVDPATIVPVTDQQTVLNGLDAATAAANAKAGV